MSFPQFNSISSYFTIESSVIPFKALRQGERVCSCVCGNMRAGHESDPACNLESPCVVLPRANHRHTKRLINLHLTLRPQSQSTWVIASKQREARTGT